ncbi:MAG TPA: dihydrofolate reductase family protein [Streptosporangiaceae bacterium]|nr:dihydrofolate reductase family protein [Streptosporangiaceae bacterium]
MRRLIYYVAATIDGFIAGPRGEVDFFPFEGEVARAILAEYPETMPVHARGPLGVADSPARHFDTVVMGRGTYEPALQAGIPSPYPHLRQYVVSTTLTATGESGDVQFAADPLRLVRELKTQDGMAIWLAGGGRLAAALLDEIDELIVKRNPIVIGSGVPMFDGLFAPTGFLPGETRSFEPGAAITTYVRGRAAGEDRTVR